jgi:hypothetical protein
MALKKLTIKAIVVPHLHKLGLQIEYKSTLIDDENTIINDDHHSDLLQKCSYQRTHGSLECDEIDN